MRITAQDVRIWGSGNFYTSTGVFGSSLGLDLHEAWLNIKLGKTTNVKIGRQEMSYDNQRLVARRNWNQFGLSYDAILLIQKIKDWRFDLALTYNTMMDLNSGRPEFSDELFNRENLIKTFNFLRINKPFGEHVNLSALVIATGYTNDDRPGVIFMTFSYGMYSKLDFNYFETTLDFYYQNGKAQTSKSVNAFAFGITPTFKIKGWRIGFGVDYMSGDDANSNNYGVEEKSFNRFYGAVYGYNGFMNYYGYIKSSTANGGLVDLYPNISWKASEKHKIDASVHFFSLANAVLIDDMVMDDLNMGTEIDTRYTFTLNKEFSFNVGFSYYLATSTFKSVKVGLNTDINQPYWAWAMITYKPMIFKN